MHDPNLTTLTCVNGANFDLLDPKPEQIDFEVIAEHLAKANRYCGATPGLVYSVAQHSTLCAQFAWEVTNDALLARYLLCHDMHEAFLGDDTTPKKRALAAIIGEFGVLSSTIEASFAQLTDRIDVAIHAAAGLAWPPTPEMEAGIKHWDRVLLATEWRDLMRCPPPYDFGVEPVFRRIEPCTSWQAARDLFLGIIVAMLDAEVT